MKATAILLAALVFLLTGCGVQANGSETDGTRSLKVMDKMVERTETETTLYLVGTRGQLCEVSSARFNAVLTGRVYRCDWSEEGP